jgi:hypothetical protein
VQSFQELVDGKELIMGASAPGSNTYDIPLLLRATLGANFKVVSGYPAAPPILLAMERGEVDGMCFTYSSLYQLARNLLEGPNPEMKFVVAMSDKTPDDPILRGVPAAGELVRTQADRQLLQAYYRPTQMAGPFVVAPDVPKARVEALRTALQRTFADPEVVDGLKRADFPFRPITGEQATQIVHEVLTLPQPVLDRLKDAVGSGG